MIHLVIGAQWGDEGKGKIVDLLSQKADASVRFHGGNNAGHTIVNHLGRFPLHLISAGIFNIKCQVFITNGVIVDLEVLNQEIETLKKVLPDFKKRLFLSPRCHVIMPYHKILDKLYEKTKGKAKTGTTGRGIGPTYADKVSYNGIRLFDFFDNNRLKEKLSVILPLKNKIIVGLGGTPLKLDEVYQEEIAKFKKIASYVKETFSPLMKLVATNKKIIYEGAQGTFLDNDWGTYPYVTGSNTVPGNINAASGIPAQYIKRVTAVSKTYTTRVGSGPFPTELFNADGEKIRTNGNEFGTTTGRPRRCGWLDLELLRFAVQINGLTDLVITKIDVLDDFKTLKIAIGYTLNGKRIKYIDCDSYLLGKVKPIYKIMNGWQQSTSKIKKFKDLPKEAKNYLKEIEKNIKIPIAIVSVGPERNQTIFC